MTKRACAALLSLTIAACSSPKNMAGLDETYNRPVALTCVEQVISSQSFVKGFKAKSDVFHFELENYPTRFFNKRLDGKLSGYSMTIDGTGVSEAPSAFYDKVHGWEETIFAAIEKQCY